MHQVIQYVGYNYNVLMYKIYPGDFYGTEYCSTLRDQLMFFYFTKFFANTMDDVPSRKLLLI